MGTYAQLSNLTCKDFASTVFTRNSTYLTKETRTMIANIGPWFISPNHLASGIWKRIRLEDHRSKRFVAITTKMCSNCSDHLKSRIQESAL